MTCSPHRPHHLAPDPQRGWQIGLVSGAQVRGARRLLLVELVVRLFVPVYNVGPAFTVHDPIYLQLLLQTVRLKMKTKKFH